MKKKPQYRRPRSRAATMFIRFGEFVLATIILLLLGGAAVMQTIAAGPSETAKRDAIAAVTKHPATSFIAEMFYSEEELEQYTASTMP